MTQNDHLIYEFPKGFFATFRQLFEQKEEIRVGGRRAIKAFTYKDDH